MAQNEEIRETRIGILSVANVTSLESDSQFPGSITKPLCVLVLSYTKLIIGLL